MSLDRSKLLSPRAQPDGTLVAACPACLRENHDSQRNHLCIWPSGAYRCSKYGKDREHNRQIKALLDDPNAEMPEFIDPEPRLMTDKVYPEAMLARLVPDYTYWVNRGAQPEVIKRLEGGLAPVDGGKLGGRFIFPVRGLDGRINGFTGRQLDEYSFAAKWKHLFKVKNAVWPWNLTGPAIRARRVAVLVESVGDTVALLGGGIEPILCIWGLQLHGRVISTLLGAGVRRIIVSLNNDDDPKKGNGAAARIRGQLLAFWPEESIRVRLPRAKDWGKCMESPEGAAELAEFRAEVEHG